MTPKPLSTAKENLASAGYFLQKADEMRRSATDNVLARRWNAATSDGIRAGMLCADAVLVFRRGLRSKSPRHEDAVELLRREFGAEVRRECTILSRLINRKHAIDYEARLATEREAIDTLEKAETLYTWASGIVQTRLP